MPRNTKYTDEEADALAVLAFSSVPISDLITDIVNCRDFTKRIAMGGAERVQIIQEMHAELERRT